MHLGEQTETEKKKAQAVKAAIKGSKVVPLSKAILT